MSYSPLVTCPTQTTGLDKGSLRALRHPPHTLDSPPAFLGLLHPQPSHRRWQHTQAHSLQAGGLPGRPSPSQDLTSALLSRMSDCVPSLCGLVPATCDRTTTKTRGSVPAAPARSSPGQLPAQGLCTLSSCCPEVSSIRKSVTGPLSPYPKVSFSTLPSPRGSPAPKSSQATLLGRALTPPSVGTLQAGLHRSPHLLCSPSPPRAQPQPNHRGGPCILTSDVRDFPC